MTAPPSDEMRRLNVLREIGWKRDEHTEAYRKEAPASVDERVTLAIACLEAFRATTNHHEARRSVLVTCAANICILIEAMDAEKK